MTIASPKGGAVVHDKISDAVGGRSANPADLISLGFKAMGVKFQPYRIEQDAMKIPGTNFVQGEPYKPFAVTDGRSSQGSNTLPACSLPNMSSRRWADARRILMLVVIGSTGPLDRLL